MLILNCRACEDGYWEQEMLMVYTNNSAGRFLMKTPAKGLCKNIIKILISKMGLTL